MLLPAVRYGIPIALVVAGVVIALIVPGATGLEAWASLTGAAFAILLLNVLYRIGVAGDVDRDREESARRYFDEHGRWPDRRSDD